jgi:hypothetical protein
MFAYNSTVVRNMIIAGGCSCTDLETVVKLSAIIGTKGIIFQTLRGRVLPLNCLCKWLIWIFETEILLCEAHELILF